MPRFPLNFQTIEEKSFPTYPPGVYVLKIVEARMETAKSSQELKESIKYEIVQGPGADTSNAGKTIFASYSLQQQAGFRLQKLLSACGIPKEQMADIDDQQLVGCIIQAQIATDMYQGKSVNRVQNESPLSGPSGASAPAAAPQTFPQGFSAPPAPTAPAGAPNVSAGPQGGPNSTWAPSWGGATGAPNGGPAPAPPPAKPVNS